MAKQQITPFEYDFLHTRLQQIVGKDKRATADLKHSLNVGSETWHDNAMFDVAKEQKQHLAREKAEIERLLRHCEVIDLPQNPQTVSIGTTVEIEDPSGEILHLKIGGAEAARLSGDWVSTAAPLVKAALGKRVKETVTVNLPAGKRVYSIRTISPIMEA